MLVECHGISGMNDETFMEGRPFGGCAMLWLKSMLCKITPIILDFKRVCAVKEVLNDNRSFILINVYMPCNATHNNSSLYEYNQILQQISSLCFIHKCDNIVIDVDFNTVFKNSISNNNVLNEFICKENLCCINSLKYSIDNTFESKANMSKSVIDHFIVSENMLSYVKDYNAIHSPDPPFTSVSCI